MPPAPNFNLLAAREMDKNERQTPSELGSGCRGGGAYWAKTPVRIILVAARHSIDIDELRIFHEHIKKAA